LKKISQYVQRFVDND